MKYGELFAGVGGMTLGFEQAGHDVRWHAEIDPFCQSVLRRHWPDVPLYGDVAELSGHALEPVDVLAFGSPCQDLSQAGKRKGLAGERSGLFLEAIRIIKEMRDATDGAAPRWAVWENVGGALNSHGGADFGRALDLLADAGALVIEWAQLDAQFFGVPQRRRRVFVVACFDPGAADRCPDPLLALAEGSRRDSVARRAARLEASGAAADGAALYVAGSERGTANCLTARQGKGIPTWMDDGGIVVYAGGKPDDTANAITARQGTRMPSRLDMNNVVLYTKLHRANHAEDPETWTEGEVSPSLTTFDNTGPVRATVLAVHLKQDPINGEVSPALSVTSGGMGVLDDGRVRRLTPVECERLMGWPDDHTAFADDGKRIADTRRGRMIGNGVATPVARWLAEQIKEV